MSSSSHRELYETNKLSNFLTLLIMFIIMLAIYKSCTKPIQTQVDQTTNEHFNRIINGADNQMATNNFPPPPPPYVDTTNDQNTYKEFKPETDNNPIIVQAGTTDAVLNNMFRDESPPPAYEESNPVPSVSVIKPNGTDNNEVILDRN